MVHNLSTNSTPELFPTIASLRPQQIIAPFSASTGSHQVGAHSSQPPHHDDPIIPSGNRRDIFNDLFSRGIPSSQQFSYCHESSSTNPNVAPNRAQRHSKSSTNHEVSQNRAQIPMSLKIEHKSQHCSNRAQIPTSLQIKTLLKIEHESRRRSKSSMILPDVTQN
mmetsp:Transcript_11934/g.25175  ORF Transcript_11934/g.25175 Transcript_11934/m.25175 type:complete len:165 (-) Transcript_11934:1109-1603(-)